MKKISGRYSKIKIKDKAHYNRPKRNISKFPNKYLFIPLIASNIILLIIIANMVYKNNKNNNNNISKDDNEFKLNLDNLDKFETDVYNKIKGILKQKRCSLMWKNQRKFLNGLVRKFKPKKILELGV